jgi:hypothetical protein
MLCRFRSSIIPTELREPALFDLTGIPRYWPSVWERLTSGDRAENTVSQKLANVERLYEHAEAMLGLGGFDDALSRVDLDDLGPVLESYFVSIRNQSAASQNSQLRWRDALGFVRDIVTWIARSAEDNAKFDKLDARLRRLEVLYSQFHIRTPVATSDCCSSPLRNARS